ncbi:MAG: DUF2764 domain-containing protein [Tannerella sp.]|jgi:hypothetical protein|nr:DUF2764 domain-containing protein [Tannerella sp.]
MSKYYYLISGLPAITPDDHKPAYTVAEFKAEITTALSVQDQKLADHFFFRYDNRNILAHLRATPRYVFDERGVYTEEMIKDICDSMASEDRAPENMQVPAYLAEFVRDYYERFDDTEASERNVLWEDRLSAMYYREAMMCGNTFLSSWFELNLNIGNVMTAFNSRKHGLDREEYIIGENEIAEQLRHSGARDFNLGNSPGYIAELLQIAEEQDLMVREKRTDVLRWNWLEDQTFFKTFDIESVLSYLLRLEMLERWAGLDQVKGKETFRRLVADMKRESRDTLNEFKENNK